LSLTARAVRAALFASTAAAAFAMAPAAFAGTCTQTATNEVTCSGVFTDNVINSVPLVNQVPNLSLILDDTTTVDPAAGVSGLTAQWGGDVAVTSYADINTVGADGIFQYGSSTAELYSYGDITTDVTAAGNNALDINAFGDVNAVVGGTVYAYNDAALNVITSSFYSVAGSVNLLVDGTGNIGAYAYDGDAIAVYVDAFADANTTIDGTLSAVSAYGNAAGLINRATGNAYAVNNGSISADAYGYANGLVSGSKYGGSSSVNNYGDITATAYNGTALGVLAYGNGVYVGNDNAITATSTYGAAIGVFGYATLGDVNFYNGAAGTISASGYDQATAVGLLSATGNVYASNYGDLYASANGDTVAAASGLYVIGATVGLYNGGDISAVANAAGATGSAYALGVDASATNLLTLDNAGTIEATATGTYSYATGVSASSATAGIVLTNEGDITATSDYSAVALDLSSDTYVDITNTGNITADGGAYSLAIDTSGGLSSDYIANYGGITGAIYTGAGDDTLYNATGATWNASGYSDFGDGDDTVLNYGTINMSDATISLGGYGTVAGNLFQNSGTITADGDNFIDVGAGGGLSGSLFVNDDTIDMQDGAADDSLTIYGDFAGTGDINVDVEGNAGVSDMLYIEGNVAADARQTINVDLIDLSAPIADLIPIVEVSGDSTAANFALGDVDFDPNTSFVDLDFSLVADIDATNATPDVFSLGIDVVGLTDTGTIAASVSPAVQSLMTTEVGTWRQRQGVIDAFNKGAISLWARVFTEKSNFSPEFASDDIGPGGNFDWKQKNRGVEAGVDFAVTDEFSLGLLVAKSKADIDLDPGSADANIDADTWGVYGTWLSPTGFYLDASYRWTKFDTDLDSLAGPMHIDKGKAETFNVELGYAWTLSGGLKIEPQFQYTKTNVHDLDLVTTSSGMTFRSEGGDSSRGRLGVAAYKGFGDADTGWRVTPYVALSAVREFDGENDFAINDTLVGRTTTEGTSALLELAVTARHEGLSIWGGLNWQDGGSIDNSLGGQIGVRYSFGGASPAPAPVPVAAPVAPAKTCADLDDDGDGVNNCDDKCPTQAGVAPDGCPAPAPEPEPAPAPKPYRG